MLTEKAALVSSVRELKLKSSGVTENNNNNHRHQELQSDSSRLTLCARCSILEGEQEDPLNFFLPLLDGIWSLILRKVSTRIYECFELYISAFSPPPRPHHPCPGWTSSCSPPAWPPSCWAWCPPWLPWWSDNVVFLSHQKCQK